MGHKKTMHNFVPNMPFSKQHTRKQKEKGGIQGPAFTLTPGRAAPGTFTLAKISELSAG